MRNKGPARPAGPPRYLCEICDRYKRQPAPLRWRLILADDAQSFVIVRARAGMPVSWDRHGRARVRLGAVSYANRSGWQYVERFIRQMQSDSESPVRLIDSLTEI